ncbi:MAG: FmdB family transcriptional regulator [Candidatus Nanopelagicaceae bacterium]|nr:FmdB family transcriptional regulator [Candidatus Nanopelagicaceae bacterium]
MPTYQYQCNACEHAFEVVQSFTDAPISACPECGKDVRKIYSNVGIVFKGSGFYKTDSASSKTESKSSSSD